MKSSTQNDRLGFNSWAMALSLVTSERSTCCRRQVGCVLTNKMGHVIATGFNGVAAGMAHCNDYVEQEEEFENGVPHNLVKYYANACEGANSPSGTNLDGCKAIHAEQNALLQCKNPYEIKNCFVTTSPCITCVKLLLNTTCQNIYFLDSYPHSEARELWEGSGRTWIQLVKPVIASLDHI